MLKTKSAGFYAGCISAVLGIIALALYFSNIANAYFANEASAGVVAASIAAVAMILGYTFLGTKSRGSKTLEYIRGLLPIGAVFCLFTAFTNFLGIRVYSMAIIYGSSLEANNTAAHSAMAQAIVTLVFYMLAGIAATVAAFNQTEKEEQKQ